MSIELLVPKDDLHIVTFPLVVGTHLLGVPDDADLVLASERVPSDVCFVKVSDDGDVSLEALPNIALHRHDGEKADVTAKRRRIPSARLSSECATSSA